MGSVSLGSPFHVRVCSARVDAVVCSACVDAVVCDSSVILMGFMFGSCLHGHLPHFRWRGEGLGLDESGPGLRLG